VKHRAKYGRLKIDVWGVIPGNDQEKYHLPLRILFNNSADEEVWVIGAMSGEIKNDRGSHTPSWATGAG